LKIAEETSPPKIQQGKSRDKGNLSEWMKQQAPLINAYDAVKMQSAARATFVPFLYMIYNDPNFPSVCYA